jgi:hypothetical protein
LRIVVDGRKWMRVLEICKGWTIIVDRGRIVEEEENG